MTSLKHRLRELLAAAGLTPTELARRSGVTQQTLQKILNGKQRTLKIDKLARLAGPLGTNVHYLATGEHLDSQRQDTQTTELLVLWGGLGKAQRRVFLDFMRLRFQSGKGQSKKKQAAAAPITPPLHPGTPSPRQLRHDNPSS